MITVGAAPAVGCCGGMTTVGGAPVAGDEGRSGARVPHSGQKRSSGVSFRPQFMQNIGAAVASGEVSTPACSGGITTVGGAPAAGADGRSGARAPHSGQKRSSGVSLCPQLAQKVGFGESPISAPWVLQD
jgi:hypothetical protein